MAGKNSRDCQRNKYKKRSLIEERKRYVLFSNLNGISFRRIKKDLSPQSLNKSSKSKNPQHFIFSIFLNN
jgi:hypothetical protein